MSKTDPIEQALNAISELRNAGPSEDLVTQLRVYLKNRSNLVVAKAAKAVGALKLSQLVPDMVTAFDRLWVNPAKLDKRCAAVTEIVSALYELDYAEPDVYIRAIHHVQKEASFGPPVDVAALLRGISAQGLLRTSYRNAISLVVDLLVDSEPPARLGAVRALASNGGEAGVLLLRLKTRTGDEDPEILGECFSGLLSAAPDESLPFVAKYLDANHDVIVEAAIWALGQSRLPAALPVLQDKWERTVDKSLRRILVAALAASRLEEAIDYLCSQLKVTDPQTALEIVTSLANYARSQSVRSAVAAAVQERGERTLAELFRQHFAAG